MKIPKLMTLKIKDSKNEDSEIKHLEIEDSEIKGSKIKDSKIKDSEIQQLKIKGFEIQNSKNAKIEDSENQILRNKKTLKLQTLKLSNFCSETYKIPVTSIVSKSYKVRYQNWPQKVLKYRNVLWYNFS